LKTIPAPGDLIYARTITVLGGKICYRSYRSESDQDASVAVIDPQTGQSKILKFTQTNNASENYQWTVSDDNSKIAWMNTEDKITVANIDGSDLQTYNTGISEIAGGSYINMRLIGNYVYFDGEPDSNGIVDLKRINLSDGSVDTVVNDMWPGGHAISNSGKYVVYTSYTSMVARSPVAIIKNLQTNTEYTIPSGAGFAAADFRPDESGVVLLFEGPDHSPAMAIDLSNGQATGTLEIVGFVSNSRVVVDSESGSGLMIMDLDGKNATKLGDLGDDFEGILILR